MKLSIVCFQKNRNVELEAAEKEYLKRLSRHATIELHALKNWDEKAGLPKKFLKGSRVIGLFIEGEAFSSEELAQRLQKHMNAGTSHLVLVIGAAEGMPAGVAAQVQERWSLSQLTFSHQLVRLLLLEALYRSFDLLRGGRYHK
jgi:23S rRNA (pseudouridine1915-N3)-methyltransferase